MSSVYVVCLIFLQTFQSYSCILSLISSTISFISFLPFSGRRHKMTHKGWHVDKPKHNQFKLTGKEDPGHTIDLRTLTEYMYTYYKIPFFYMCDLYDKAIFSIKILRVLEQ